MAKKARKNKVPSAKYKKYEIRDGSVVRNKYCPKCGPGTFLAEHKDRFYCGNCHYMEKKSRESLEKPER